MRLARPILLLITLTVLSLCSLALVIAWPRPQLTPTAADAPERSRQWFRDAKLGVMFTWGPVSLLGTEISWSRSDHRFESGKGVVPVEEYDRLYERFNPVDFDADEWVRLVQEAGARYVVFVAKHHDGFCMFDSALTDYKVTRSPFGRDIAAEIAAAAHRAGLRLGFYYSQPDWHHADYRAAQHHRYVDYLHGQVRELCSRYGRVDVLWFDGLYWRAHDWDAPRLVASIRRLQPEVLINDRNGLEGDFVTPEQSLGPFTTRRAWETCLSLGEQWAWKPDDRIKSAGDCLQKLVRCAGSGGNLLLNVGPRPDGRIDPEQAARLRDIGRWLRKYGRSIYGTRGGPLLPGEWGVSTHRGHTLYLHLLQQGELTLPKLPSQVMHAELLTPGRFTLAQNPHETRITISPADPDEVDHILALRMRGHIFSP